MDEALKRLRSGLAQNTELLGVLDIIQDGLTNRSRIEQDMRGVVANKDAEMARLRAEMSRMRTMLSSAGSQQESHADEVSTLQAQLQQALSANRLLERQAVMAAASPAASTAQGEVHRLQAELDARQALVTRLEADLAAQAAAASARLTDLQNTFMAKIQDMRRAHQEALAAAERAASSSSVPLQADLASLRQQLRQKSDEVASLQAQLEAQQTSSKDVHARLLQVQAQQEQERQRHADEVRQLTAAKEKLEQRCKAAEQQAAAAQQQKPGSSGQAAAAPSSGAAAAAGSNGGSGGGSGDAAGGIDLSMLAIMEGQLQRLSEIIRLRESEIRELRAAFQAGCDERRDLSVELQRLQGAAQGAGGGSSGQGHKAHANDDGPTSPSSQASSPSGRKPSGPSLGKPYRTGLQSKPKFR